MKIEDFKKAEGIIKQIDAIKAIVDRHSIGEVEESDTFEDGRHDFYGDNFFYVKNYSKQESTGGGSVSLPRCKICECQDGSGEAYHLDKQETFALQNFILEMLEIKLHVLEDKLKNI